LPEALSDEVGEEPGLLRADDPGDRDGAVVAAAEHVADDRAGHDQHEHQDDQQTGPSHSPILRA
jgi:hypothetical protein